MSKVPVRVIRGPTGEPMYVPQDALAKDWRGDIRSMLYLGLFVSILYIILFIAYLICVVYFLNIPYGYLRPDLTPGPFTNDRYAFEWWLLAINTIRVFIPSIFMWTFIRVLSSWKRDWLKLLLSFVIPFDLFTLISLTVILFFFCNNPSYPVSYCNDPIEYCLAFNDTHPDRCPPTGQPPLDPSTLCPNSRFLKWIYFMIGFLIFDFIILWSNKRMTKNVRRILFRGHLKAGGPPSMI